MLNVESEMLNEDPIQHSTSNIQHSSSPSPNWRLIYALVLGELAATIVIFYIFTRVFA
jgi:hypothetical protein